MQIIVEREQLIRELIQREAHFAKTVGQNFVDIVQLTPSRRGMGGDHLIICPPDLLVELQVGRAATTAALRAFVKNSADEKGIIPDVRAKEEGLFGRRPRQRD